MNFHFVVCVAQIRTIPKQMHVKLHEEDVVGLQNVDGGGVSGKRRFSKRVQIQLRSIAGFI